MAEIQENDKWASMLRGQVMAATTLKLMQLMRMLDQKAQIMILLNSILIPFCIKSYESGMFKYAAGISIVTALISIMMAIICIYPKRKYRKSGDPGINLLHFNDIGHMEEEEYLKLFMPEFNDLSRFSRMVVHDIHDTSRHSIIPKYIWLKISYSVFFFGNLLAIAVAFIRM